MFKRDLGFPTFWRLQVVGWICYCLSVFILLLPSLKQPGTLRASGLFVAVMFTVSCLMRPVCRFLMRRRLSWIALEMRAIVCCIPAGAIAGYLIEVLTSPNRALHWPDWLAYSAQATFLLFLWCNLYFSVKKWQSWNGKENAYCGLSPKHATPGSALYAISSIRIFYSIR